MFSEQGGGPFYLKHDNIFAVPISHYKMEMAAQVRLAFEAIQPDCVAVELAETQQLQLLHAASRLPDVTVVTAYGPKQEPTYYLAEPCDGAFEALRSALEVGIPAYCIDLDVQDYPEVQEFLPDPYSIFRIGLKGYYEAYERIAFNHAHIKGSLDSSRELYMARRLKELSLSYERILFVGGMYHVRDVLKGMELSNFSTQASLPRMQIEVATLTDASCRDVLAEPGFIVRGYEEWRQKAKKEHIPDRQKLIYELLKEAAEAYIEKTGHEFPGYHMRNIMKFLRNYALLQDSLMPDLFQILTAAKGCVDHNYAYEVWLLATHSPFRSNVDNLRELSLSVEDIWGKSKRVHFHLKAKARKAFDYQKRQKDRSKFRFSLPGPFSICSYPPEDLNIERFADYLKKRGVQLLVEEGARVVPFSTSLEDGIDTKETIRHWHEKKLYVKTKGKPPGGVGSIVIIFNEDKPKEGVLYREQYPWKMTWLGEHTQESDMAFYATQMTENVVGPGISRCEYGGFMMTYPPRRLFDVWRDPDYEECATKAELLLTAAIDYAVDRVVVYVAAAPPRSALKSFARRFGKKIVYIPLGQLSPQLMNKTRIFHVLDGHHRREGAEEYIL